MIPNVPVRQWVLSPLKFMQRLAALVPKPHEADVAQSFVDLGEVHRLRPSHIGWAKLLKRVFNINLAHCPNRGAELRIIAAIGSGLGGSAGAAKAGGFKGDGAGTKWGEVRAAQSYQHHLPSSLP